jgi:hypothetical protein
MPTSLEDTFRSIPSQSGASTSEVTAVQTAVDSTNLGTIDYTQLAASLDTAYASLLESSRVDLTNPNNQVKIAFTGQTGADQFVGGFVNTTARVVFAFAQDLLMRTFGPSVVSLTGVYDCQTANAVAAIGPTARGETPASGGGGVQFAPLGVSEFSYLMTYSPQMFALIAGSVPNLGRIYVPKPAPAEPYFKPAPVPAGCTAATDDDDEIKKAGVAGGWWAVGALALVGAAYAFWPQITKAIKKVR